MFRVRPRNEFGLIKIKNRGKEQNQYEKSACFVVKKQTCKTEKSIAPGDFPFQQYQSKKYDCKENPEISPCEQEWSGRIECKKVFHSVFLSVFVITHPGL